MSPRRPSQIPPTRAKPWCAPSDGLSSGEEFHIRRALLMEENTKYTPDEDDADDEADSDAEVDKFVRSGIAMYIESPRRRLKGKQKVDIEDEDADKPQKKRRKLWRKLTPIALPPPPEQPAPLPDALQSAQAEAPPALPLPRLPEPAQAPVAMDPVKIESSDDESCPQLYSEDDTDHDVQEADDSSDDDPVIVRVTGPEDKQARAPQTKPGDTLPKPVPRRQSDMAAEARGLSGKSYRKMVRLGAPVLLMNILFFLFQAPSVSNVRDLLCVEYFAGVSSVYRGAVARGFPSAKCDIIFEPHLHDIMSVSGFIYAIQLARRQCAGALSHFATVCSTWVWICRASTKRSVLEPLSPFPWSDCVANANNMVARMSLLLMICMGLDAIWVLEQPSSSLMCLHPRMVQLKKAMEHLGGPSKRSWWHTHTWMGMYGGRTPKATRLWSNSELVLRLHRTLDRSLHFEPEVTASVASDGSVTGNRDEMKESQAYPDAYGVAVSELIVRSTASVLSDSDDSSASPEFDDDTWDDIGSEEIAAAIQIPRDRLL